MREKRKERVKVNRMHIYVCVCVFKYVYINICIMQLHMYKIVGGNQPKSQSCGQEKAQQVAYCTA